MINRKNTLVMLAAFVMVGGVVLGTGAFSTVEADRTVDINTAGDSNALLELQANNSAVAETEDSGTSTIAIANDSINANATTTFEYAINVSNNGNNDVGFYVADEDYVGQGEVLDIKDTSTGNTLVGSENATNLNSGGGEVDLTVVIDLRNGSETDLSNLDSVTFVADEDQSST